MSITYTLIKLHKPEYYELHKGNWFAAEEWLAPGVPALHLAVSLKEDVFTYHTFADLDFSMMADHILKWIGNDAVIVQADGNDLTPPYEANTPLIPLDEIKRRLGITVEDLTTYRRTGDRYDVFIKE